MKLVLCLFMILVVVSRESIYASHRSPRHLNHSKCCNVAESASRTEIIDKLKGFREICYKELGLNGKNIFFQIINRA